LLSPTGEHYLAGLLAAAAESCLLTSPTVTAYKRYRPESLAPYRAAWGTQHRGAMLRIVGGAGDPATRIENRVGDSAANPYLYLTAQMVSGLAGIEAGAAPPPASESPYEPAAGPRLPGSLGEAAEAFAASDLYRSALGDGFVDYLTGLKRAEWNRFLSTVTDWEQTEYLDLF
jgi:glutamine synthetase